MPIPLFRLAFCRPVTGACVSYETAVSDNQDAFRGEGWVDEQRLVIAGGSVAGLATALAAGRKGIRSVVLERDGAPLADSPEAAFEVSRRGAPQAHQGHGFLARFTVVLRERFPDLLDALLEAGAHSLPLTRDLGEPMPGDEDLAILALRRTTLEWVLRRAALAEPHVELRNDVAVAGVVAAGDEGPVPHIVGARLDTGEVLDASAVVAATGRRGDVPAWLGELGVEVPETEVDTRLVYLTRWYRRPDDHIEQLPPRLGGDLVWLKYLAVPCDAGTFSITLAVPRDDAELRKSLADAERFDQACRMLTGPRELFADAPMTPITEVLPMGGLVNRIRRFVDRDGEPRVTGFHAVGDAHTCTNPLYGRGCSLAFVQATLLADALVEHAADPAAQVTAYEAGSAREVEPWYHAAVQMDAYRIPQPGSTDADGSAAGGAGGGESPTDLFTRVVIEGGTDPIIGRAIIRVFNLLALPQELLTDTELMARVAPILAKPAPAERPALEGPTREELLA
jgi:2-polyprenyl-6-methoxyphenol hydroxylase-like FAD-dependent oxidoreductase